MTTTDQKHQKISLIIGLGIPVLMVVFIAAAIHLPRWLSTPIDPAFDFLYSVGWPQEFSYRVEQGRLLRVDSKPPAHGGRGDGARLYLHDVSANRSRELTWDQASRLLLDSAPASPDGFRVESGRKPGWFFFDYRHDYNRRFLVRNHHSIEQSLEFSASGPYYGSSFRLLGWVVEPGQEVTDG
ncbi:MAG: hypothetical protein QNJ40_11215 [Xanthomonadales bacterium]|nr:hypothetical protein [Xanthomonadales bacterium]